METLSIPEDQITPEANLEADLGISSLELYELGGRLMEEYDIDIEEDEIHTFITVNDIVEYISSHTKLSKAKLMRSRFSTPHYH